jgi:hypothetical protein
MSWPFRRNRQPPGRTQSGDTPQDRWRAVRDVLAWNPGYIPGCVLRGHYGSRSRWPYRDGGLAGPRTAASFTCNDARTEGA